MSYQQSELSNKWLADRKKNVRNSTFFNPIKRDQRFVQMLQQNKHASEHLRQHTTALECRGANQSHSATSPPEAVKLKVSDAGEDEEQPYRSPKSFRVNVQTHQWVLTKLTNSNSQGNKTFPHKTCT